MAMTAPFVIALLPVDIRGLPKVPGVKIPEPSEEHTHADCDLCGRDCWIGPTQRMQKLYSGSPAVCYYCLVRAMQADDDTDFQVVALNPANDDVPRMP